MHKNVFSNSEVADYQEKNFVSVEINIDRFPDSLKTWGIKVVPLTIILTPDGERLTDMGDEYDAKIYLRKLENVRAKAAKLDELKKNATDAPGHRALGEFYLSINDHARAAKSLQVSVDLKEDPETLILLGDARIQTGAAPEELEKIADKLSEHPDNALFLRAMAAYSRGDLQALHDRITDLRATYPDSDKADAAMVWHGYTLMELKKDRKEAKRVYQEFLKKFPNSKLRDHVQSVLRRDLRDE
jgi:TolA-binding protein